MGATKARGAIIVSAARSNYDSKKMQGYVQDSVVWTNERRVYGGDMVVVDWGVKMGAY